MKRETVEVVRVLLAMASVSRGSRAHAGLAVLARREGAQLCGGGWLAVLDCWLEGWKPRCREAPQERFGQSHAEGAGANVERTPARRTPPKIGFQKRDGAGTLSIVRYVLLQRLSFRILRSRRGSLVRHALLRVHPFSSSLLISSHFLIFHASHRPVGTPCRSSQSIKTLFPLPVTVSASALLVKRASLVQAWGLKPILESLCPLHCLYPTLPDACKGPPSLTSFISKHLQR
jgi:hypothetical protein